MMQVYVYIWPRGLMDKASDFGSEDCEFESRRGRILKGQQYNAVDNAKYSMQRQHENNMQLSTAAKDHIRICHVLVNCKSYNKGIQWVNLFCVI